MRPALPVEVQAAKGVFVAPLVVGGRTSRPDLIIGIVIRREQSHRLQTAVLVCPRVDPTGAHAATGVTPEFRRAVAQRTAVHLLVAGVMHTLRRIRDLHLVPRQIRASPRSLRMPFEERTPRDEKYVSCILRAATAPPLVDLVNKDVAVLRLAQSLWSAPRETASA